MTKRVWTVDDASNLATWEEQSTGVSDVALVPLVQPIAVSQAATMTITPDGSEVWLPRGTGTTVKAISTKTYVLGTPFDVGSSGPIMAAFSRDGTKAYVVSNPGGDLVPVDVASKVAGAPIMSGLATPWGVFVRPDGVTGYVTESGAGGIVPFDVATDVPGSLIATGDQPDYMAFTSDSKFGWVANSGGVSVSVVDLVAGAVIDTLLTPAITSPQGIGVSPDGASVFVAAFEGVQVIDGVTHELLDLLPVPGFSGVGQVAFSPSGKTLYAVYPSGVYRIDVDARAFVDGPPIRTAASNLGLIVVSDELVWVSDGGSIYPISPVALGALPA